jgi:hypothetical protein
MQGCIDRSTDYTNSPRLSLSMSLVSPEGTSAVILPPLIPISAQVYLRGSKNAVSGRKTIREVKGFSKRYLQFF